MLTPLTDNFDRANEIWWLWVLNLSVSNVHIYIWIHMTCNYTLFGAGGSWPTHGTRSKAKCCFVLREGGSSDFKSTVPRILKDAFGACRCSCAHPVFLDTDRWPHYTLHPIDLRTSYLLVDASSKLLSGCLLDTSASELHTTIPNYLWFTSTLNINESSSRCVR